MASNASFWAWRVAALREQWLAGLDAAAIGENLECSKNAVISKAASLGLPIRPNRRQGISPWSPDDEVKLQEDYAAGMRVPLMAAHLGRTVAACTHKIKQLKLPPRPAISAEEIRLAKAASRAAGPPVAAARQPAPVTLAMPASVPASDTALLPAEVDAGADDGADYGARNVATLRSPRLCQWPTGTERPLIFCDEAAVRGRSYCTMHCAKAFVPPARRKDLFGRM